MLTFQYKHGDRPLEGYTIQRGAGRGGFGEVYYAVSDTGREIALKVLTAYEQIELRGIGHCMNLKNPHLVTIFDVRYNDQGRPFVIMEYVAGPSLRQLLDESPAGLGTQKAAFFLREIGKGLTFLHDHGIVHRDLKPANIFFENGYVKIGDYGLSKLIATTHTSAQTVTVGTVHYMAPEIGAGKYDRGIDIYALGAVLYEMLTGMVPFTGASPSEVLMKHLGTQPDLSAVPEPFAAVIRKAMAKDPSQRYQSVQEMVEAVFGAEHIRQSVSVFSPDQLSMVAAHATVRRPVAVAAAAGGSSGGSHAGGHADPWQAAGAHLGRIGERLAGVGEYMVDLGVRTIRPGKGTAVEGVNSRTMEVAPPPLPGADPLSRMQRLTIALIAAGVAALLAGAVAPHSRRPDTAVMSAFFVFFASIGGAIGIRLAVRRLLPQMHNESEAIHRIGVGGLASLFAALCSFPFWVGGDVTREPGALWLAILVPLFFMNAARWAVPDRAERVTFWDTIFLAGLFSFALSALFHDGSLVPVVAIAGICAFTQTISRWDPAAARLEEDSVPVMPPQTNAPPPPAPAPQAANAPTRKWSDRREERMWQREMRRLERLHHKRESRRGGWFFSFIAFCLLVPAMLLAISIALEFPQALAAGVPDPSLTRELNNDLFNGYPAWPQLLERLATFTTVLLAILALLATLVARRRCGIAHLLRGLAGITLIMTAALPLEGSFLTRRNVLHPWAVVAEHIDRNAPAAAVAALVDAFEAPVLLLAALWFVTGVVVLLWPAREAAASPAATTTPPAPPPQPLQGAAQ